jgi:hypothetical protein
MNPRRYYLRPCSPFLIASFILLAIGALAAPAVDSVPTAIEKEAVIDGSVVHDVGELASNVTNWGVIGSMPGAGLMMSDAPSAQWPKYSGIEYLFVAGPWVGGVVNGEALVSTGGFPAEFLPTEPPVDTIYATAHGAPGGNRFPWSDADDDGDGQEDEELLNGLDDDGDGLIDEDFAAIGDQHFVCGYNDFEPALLASNPDHTPLNVTVAQQSIQWSGPLAEDFIGYDFTITNVGVVTIEQVYLGMFSDFDIGPRGIPVAEDDMAGSWVGDVQVADGRWVNVQMGYMYDGATVSPVDGYAGWVLCGHTTDPTGASAPVEPAVRTFQKFSGQAPFNEGGDPTNDTERYELLSLGADHWDGDSLPGQEADYRVLMSSGPFPSLAPGESISYQVALVLGLGLDDMITNAAEAVAAYRGVAYDRDGDPANGAEATVDWLLAEDAPVSARTGWIAGRLVPGGVELSIETNMARVDGLTVRRRSGSDSTERQWTGSDLIYDRASGHNHLFHLLDTNMTGWPRTYDLVLEEAGRSQIWGQVELDLPQHTFAELNASPNPFNPLVNVRFSLPQAGHIMLQAFDVRGRLVRTLVDEVRPAGSDIVVWHGDDDAGRALASGVYQLRLATEGRLVEERVTLVR